MGDLTVVKDVTPDTAFITITGDVPSEEVRHLVEEMTIAPGPDDISLFTTVREFDVDRWGRMWVFDNDSRAILVFEADGTLVRRVGRRGAGPGEFGSNNGMVILPDGGLAIWDGGNTRVSLFDSAGVFRESWPVPGGFGTVHGLVVDRDGTLYMRRPIAEATGQRGFGTIGLVRLGPTGEFQDSIALPPLSVEQHIYMAEGNGSRMGMGADYAAAAYRAISPSRTFITADGGQYRIVIVPPNDRPTVISRVMSEVPVDPEERAIEEARMIWMARQTQPDWTWSGPPLPTVKAPLVGVRAGRDERVWARVAVESDTIPGTELEPPRDPTMPVLRHRMPHMFEVFSPGGDLLGRVAVPPRTQIMESDGNLVWALVTDADGLPAVVRYRIEPEFDRGP
jgi:hypothetical protein